MPVNRKKGKTPIKKWFSLEDAERYLQRRARYEGRSSTLRKAQRLLRMMAA